MEDMCVYGEQSELRGPVAAVKKKWGALRGKINL